MPNVAVVLKAEISRLARKEVRAANRPLRSACVALKRRAAAQGRQLTALTRELNRLRKSAGRPVATETATPEAGARARFSSGLIKRLRTRLDLSQSELAQLANVSPIAVYMWERKGGRLQLRSATRTALLDVRQLGKREARRRLDELKASAAKPKAKAKAKARKAVRRVGKRRGRK